MYSVVDLFAGAGGLSLGFRQTQKFEIKAAFEKNLNAQKTYIKNHKDTDMYKDVCTAVYKDIINKYSPSKVARQIESLYNECLCY